MFSIFRVNLYCYVTFKMFKILIAHSRKNDVPIVARSWEDTQLEMGQDMMHLLVTQLENQQHW